MTIFLETKRLVLKTPSLDALDEFVILQSDPDVMQFIGTGVRTKEKVINATESAIKHFQDHGFSICSLYEKDTGNFVGQAGLLYLEYNDKQPDIEIGYRLHKRYWRRRYASEIAKAIIVWGFTHISVDHLIAITHPDNVKSQAVLNKIGMRFVGRQIAYGSEVFKFIIPKRDVMNQSTDPIVYRGMTAKQVAEAYDDFLSIPNFLDLLRENRERAQVVKEKLQPIQNISYGDEPLQKLDIYAPKNAKELPVLIDVHGGGWTAGSKDVRSIPAENIMSQNIIWVPIDYGLAPEYRIEDMISHVCLAITWVYKNIFQYGGDPNHIYISGHSAGAHLAATALMPNRHDVFDVPENLIKGLIVASGIYDLEGLLHAEKNETQDILKLNLAEAKRVSPFHHLPKYSIPTIIAYGAKEPLAYAVESKEYAKKLESVGFNVSMIVVPNANHFDMLNELAKSEGNLSKDSIEMINHNA